LTNEDKIFLGQQKDAEHIKVFRRLIREYKDVMLTAIAGAKDAHQLAIAQGVIRGMNALEHTLTTQIVLGEALVKESEK
jgi:pantothenate synthetase